MIQFIFHYEFTQESAQTTSMSTTSDNSQRLSDFGHLTTKFKTRKQRSKLLPVHKHDPQVYQSSPWTAQSEDHKQGHGLHLPQ